ncbi:hypothetical protein RD792_003608 [Penstemon davidsonii]|uniref:Protein kinase domain-containing protein n=1 Tax=Penstemon davidsonii TaxID=160366 RepID=A0ABR0DFZ4_9LAMI|nr:hypothetical protein RD792_003608 [Penstemon davidsonii]
MSCFPCFQKKLENVVFIVSVLNNNKPTPSVEANNKPEAFEAEDGENTAKTFTFRELATATKNFRQECLLGEGGFGRVFRATLPQSGQIVAVRQLDRSGTQASKEFLVEVMMLSLLHHPNLIKMIGYCADGDQRLLVYEYMPSGCLKSHLFDLPANKKPLDWSARMKIASGIAQGLEYLHEKANPPIIYRDLKSSNILLDETNNPRLSEYGLAKLVQSGNTMHVSPRVMGSNGYCAPEYERQGELTLKSDVYSFGVVLLELITGRRALDTTRPTEEQNLVTWAQPIFSDPKRFPDMADPLLKSGFPVTSLNQAVGVAAMCLQDEPSVRPLISDVVAALSFLASAPPEAPIPARLVPMLSVRVDPTSHRCSVDNGNMSTRFKTEVTSSDSEDDKNHKKQHPINHKNSSDSESDDSSQSSDNESGNKQESKKWSSSLKRKSTKGKRSSVSRSSSNSSIGSRDFSLGFSLRCDSSYPERNVPSESNHDVIHESHEYGSDSSSDEEESSRTTDMHNISLSSNVRHKSSLKSSGGDFSSRKYDNVEMSMRSDDGSENLYSRNSSIMDSEYGDDDRSKY